MPNMEPRFIPMLQSSSYFSQTRIYSTHFDVIWHLQAAELWHCANIWNLQAAQLWHYANI